MSKKITHNSRRTEYLDHDIFIPHTALMDILENYFLLPLPANRNHVSIVNEGGNIILYWRDTENDTYNGTNTTSVQVNISERV